MGIKRWVARRAFVRLCRKLHARIAQEDSMAWLLSRTLWFSILTAVAAILEALGIGAAVEVLENGKEVIQHGGIPEIAKWVFGSLAMIFLRFKKDR